MVKLASNDIVTLENVSKSFGGPRVLDSCSFRIHKNTIVAIIGPNGSGKTTLFNIICGFIKPDSGRVFVNGKNIENLNVSAISNLGVSRMFQQSSFFPNLDVLQNLLLAIDNEDMKVLKNMTHNESLEEKIKTIKDILKSIGANVNLSRLPHELSFGEQKIVEMARALIKSHKIIIMDEPMSGLSSHMKMKMKALFLRLKKNKETVFLAEHDINFVSKVADRIIFIERGKVTLDTTPEKITNESIFSKIYLGE